MVFKISNLFIAYFFIDTYNKAMLQEDYSINFILLTIAVVASLIGSTFQVASVNFKLPNKIKFNHVFLIYSAGTFVSYISYELGSYYESAPLTGLSSVILSYFSVEFLEAFKDTVISTIKSLRKVLPQVIGDILRYKLGGGKNNNNDIDENDNIN